MRIDRKLNLVLEVERGDAPPVYVHSMPIRRESFEANYLIVAKAFSRIYSSGIGGIGAPRIAALMLKDVAEETDGASATALMNEIRRLSSVVARGDAGWETVPLEEAISRKVLSDDELSEVENAICFFTVASAMHRRAGLEESLVLMQRLWGAQVTSSNSTEFAASLATSTATANTGARETASSIPS